MQRLLLTINLYRYEDKTKPTHIRFESSEEAETSRSGPKKKKKKKKHKQYVLLCNVITCIYLQGDNEKKRPVNKCVHNFWQ